MRQGLPPCGCRLAVALPGRSSAAARWSRGLVGPPATRTRMKSIRYLGAKTSLISALLDDFSLIRGARPASDVSVVDLFCGSAVVSHAAASAGYRVRSSDSESYARTLAAGATTSYTSAAGVAIGSMNDAAAAARAVAAGWTHGDTTRDVGRLALEYSPAGPHRRMFWTTENAAAIDAARQQVDSHDASLRPFLLASLLVSADAVANTTAVYGAYLKAFKPSALKPMVISPLHVNPNLAPTGSDVLEATDAQDALALLASEPQRPGVTIIYADPPYNNRQYSANYAPLRCETHSPRSATSILMPPSPALQVAHRLCSWQLCGPLGDQGGPSPRPVPLRVLPGEGRAPGV